MYSAHCILLIAAIYRSLLLKKWHSKKIKFSRKGEKTIFQLDIILLIESDNIGKK